MKIMKQILKGLTKKPENPDRLANNPWERIFSHGVPVDLEEPSNNLPIIIKLFKHKKVEKVLDVAMGAGRNSSELAKNGFQVFGFDLSPSGIKLTEQSFNKLGLSGFFIQADMFDKFPYKNNFFDGVIAIQAIYHGTKADMEIAIHEVARVLKKDGIFFFNTSRDKTRPLKGAEELKIRRINDQTYLPLAGREKGLIHFYPTEMEINKMLQANFKDISITYDKMNDYLVIICRKR